jgi:signal transduction histidine kinase
VDSARTSAADPSGLARAIARLSGARWTLLRERSGGWIEVAEAGAGASRSGSRPSRRVDFGLSTGSAPGLVRVGRPAIERSARHADSDLSEICFYRAVPGPRAGAVLGLARPLTIDPAALEVVLRLWFAVGEPAPDAGDERRGDRWSRVGREAARTAHDLRNHLTVAGLELQASAELIPPTSRARSGIRRALAEIAAARELCERSLGRGPASRRGQAVDLREFLRGEARAVARASGRGENVPVLLRCPVDLVVRVDRLLLGRLVRNLLLNALAASPDGEAIVIEVEETADDKVRVAVSDRGKGMGAREMQDLLQFGSSGSGGAGIGTSSARCCARSLGTELEFRSALGTGTSVSFRLPSAGRGG